MEICQIVISAIVYFLSVYGISTIISQEYIFAPVIDSFQPWPKLYYLLTCNKCMTVWVAFLLSLCGFGVVHPLVDPFAAYTVTIWLNNVLEEEVEEVDKPL